MSASSSIRFRFGSWPSFRPFADLFSPDLTPGPRLTTVAAYALAFTALMGLTLVRQPGVPAIETLVADDGLFLADAVNQGYSVGRRLVDPYAGYMQLPPRLLAELASHLPLEWAALVMSGGAAVVVALLALFVFRASVAIPSLSLRAALAGAMVLLPMANSDVLSVAANLHWFLIFAAFWAFIWVPQRLAGRLVSAAIVAMATLSDPLTLLLAPLAIARALTIRSWRDHLVNIAFIGAGLVQLGVVWVAPYLGAGSRPIQGADAYSLTQIFGTVVVAVNIVGVPLTERFWGAAGAVVPWLGVAAVVAFALYVLRQPASHARSLALILLGMSVVYFVVPFWIAGTVDVSPVTSFLRARYLIIPALLLLASFFLIVSQAGSRVDGIRRPIVLVVIVWYAAVAAMSFVYPNNRADGPAWASALAQSRESCPATAKIEVPITPVGWVVKLDCQDLGE